MKKTINLLLAITLLVSMFSFMPNDAQADKAYNPQAAISYAKDHWNDNVGKCANFVKKCLIAGGLDVSGDSPSVLLSSLQKKASGKLNELSRSGNYVKATSDKVAIGDPIFIYCQKCKVYPHVVICGGAKDGCVTYYAHNEVVDKNGKMGGVGNTKKLNLNWTSGDHNGHTLVAKAFHISINSSSTINPRPVAQSDFSLSTKAGSISVDCKTKPEATHYELTYSSDSAFKKDTKSTKLIVPKLFKSITFNIKNLKSGKTYYVKIRACILMPYCDKNGDVYYYSDYCKPKSIKVK